MIKRFSILLFTFVLMVALVGACGGGGSDDDQSNPDSSKTPVSTAASDDAQVIEDAEAFFQNPPQFELDLDGEKAFDDFAVLDVSIDIPDIGMDSLDFDLEFDPAAGIDDSLTVPSTASLLGDLPGFPSTGSGGAMPPAGYQPSPDECAGYNFPANCAWVPEAVRDLCEQCKAQGN